MKNKTAEDLRFKILETIADLYETKNISRSARKSGLDLKTFFEALDELPDLAHKYEIVQKAIAEIAVFETITIADESEDAAKARNQINVRQWAATRFKAEKFGDKLELSQNKTVNINIALENAKTRIVLPMYDTSQAELVQAIDSTKLIDTVHTELTSVDPTQKQSDDIYD